LTAGGERPAIGRSQPPLLVVVGVDALGTELVRLVLGHGDDPTELLAGQGWKVRRARDIMSDSVGTHVLTMTFVVEPSLVDGPSGISPFEPQVLTRQDAGLVMSRDEVPERHQRVAAYAVVTSARGVLMTQFSGRTNAEGRWGLPGGGVESGEAPELAVVREAWEESGQVIEVSDLALIRTSHWIGRAPTGRLEDFHAVRVVYHASCPEPSEPVVQDVGGTTASAAWVPWSDLDRLDVTSSWRSLLGDMARLGESRPGTSATSGVIVAPDEADGASHHEHDPDDDDSARSQG
jgi:8-oxo-dGTP pyrophosphatase MutT (NUDIX family)